MTYRSNKAYGTRAQQLYKTKASTVQGITLNPKTSSRAKRPYKLNMDKAMIFQI